MRLKHVTGHPFEARGGLPGLTLSITRHGTPYRAGFNHARKRCIQPAHGISASSQIRDSSDTCSRTHSLGPLSSFQTPNRILALWRPRGTGCTLYPSFRYGLRVCPQVFRKEQKRHSGHVVRQQCRARARARARVRPRGRGLACPPGAVRTCRGRRLLPGRPLSSSGWQLRSWVLRVHKIRI